MKKSYNLLLKQMISENSMTDGIKRIIKNMFDKQDDKFKKCSICFESIKEIALLKCGHILCVNCVNKLIELNSKKCAECREVFENYLKI